jgi:hypothetical protein
LFLVRYDKRNTGRENEKVSSKAGREKGRQKHSIREGQ